MLLDLSLKTMTLILIEVIFLNDGSTITEDLPDSEVQLFKSRGLKRQCLIVWFKKISISTPLDGHRKFQGDGSLKAKNLSLRGLDSHTLFSNDFETHFDRPF